MTLAKPRITIYSDALERWRIDFGPAIGEVWLDPSDRGAWPSRCYRWRLDALEVAGKSYARDRAVRSLWCRAAQLEVPPPVEALDALALAHQAEFGGASKAAALLRELLQLRTGRRWSVRAGRGRERNAVTIASLPRERVAGQVSAADAALLAAVLRVDYVGAQGHTVPARIGERARVVLAIIGDLELERLDWRTVRAAVERGAEFSLH